MEREITHGIAIAIYFLDPEGNRIEVYWATDKDIPQPFGGPSTWTSQPRRCWPRPKR